MIVIVISIRVHTVTAVLLRMVRSVADSAINEKAVAEPLPAP